MHDTWFHRGSYGSPFINQGRIQVCFDSIQPLWAPKKTAQIFLQVQIYNRIFC